MNILKFVLLKCYFCLKLFILIIHSFNILDLNKIIYLIRIIKEKKNLFCDCSQNFGAKTTKSDAIKRNFLIKKKNVIIIRWKH